MRRILHCKHGGLYLLAKLQRLEILLVKIRLLKKTCIEMHHFISSVRVRINYFCYGVHLEVCVFTFHLEIVAFEVGTIHRRNLFLTTQHASCT